MNAPAVPPNATEVNRSVPLIIPVPPRRPPWYSWRQLGYNFLTLSLLVHLLLGIGAAYFVVSVTYPKKKNFNGGPPAEGTSKRAVEHKVSMAKAKQRSSAPVAVKRVTTTGASKVALPSMPALPTNSAVVPVSMAGMGGQGSAIGGLGSGGGSGGGGGGGPGSLFGMRNLTAGALVGHLYDLKQTRNRQPTGMTTDQYARVVTQFVQGGFNQGVLSTYFRASTTLYATQMFTPMILAEEAPKAFGVEAEVQPQLWLATYSAKVIPTESGTYRFVGFGDDVLVVRFNGKLVLDRGYLVPSGFRPSQTYHYQFSAGSWYASEEHTSGHGEGLPMGVEAGKPYDLQILIGEQPGGDSMFQLLIKKDGVEYRKDQAGNPILPIFRLKAVDNQPSGNLPPFDPGGPVWRAVAPLPTQ